MCHALASRDFPGSENLKANFARSLPAVQSPLAAHALNNAREALGRKLAESASQARLLDALARTLHLAKTPQRIEVYDNSHLQGKNAVGAMIVAGPEGFQKNQYRKFNMQGGDLAPGDDYGMMRQMMEVKTTSNTRRRVAYGIVAELSFLLIVVLVFR